MKCEYCGKEVWKGYLNGEVATIEEYDTRISKNCFDIRKGTIIGKRKHTCNKGDIVETKMVKAQSEIAFLESLREPFNNPFDRLKIERRIRELKKEYIGK